MDKKQADTGKAVSLYYKKETRNDAAGVPLVALDIAVDPFCNGRLNDSVINQPLRKSPKPLYLCFLRDVNFPIVELKILDEKYFDQIIIPDGFEKANLDMNKGAGHDYIYIAYRRGIQDKALYDIDAVWGKNEKEAKDKKPEGYAILDGNLNHTVGGNFIYLTFTAADSVAKRSSPVMGIVGVFGKKQPPQDGFSWEFIDANMNKGTGKKTDDIWVYRTWQTLIR